MAFKLFVRRISRPELIEEVRFDDEHAVTALTYVSLFTHKGDTWRSVFVAPENSTFEARGQLRFAADAAMLREHDLDLINTVGVQAIAD